MPDKVKGRRPTRISSKNQVTLPVHVLREAGLAPGDLVEVVAMRTGIIELRRFRSRIGEFVGVLDGWDFDIDADRESWTEREREIWGPDYDEISGGKDAK